jgi:hypothetical protein
MAVVVVVVVIEPVLVRLEHVLAVLLLLLLIRMKTFGGRMAKDDAEETSKEAIKNSVVRMGGMWMSKES